MADYGQSAFTLAESMEKNGYTVQDINVALSDFAKGDHPEGQDPARGFLEAWGNMVGIPLDVFWSNEQMTPEKAAEILSGGYPTTTAKALQFTAAKAYLAFAKSGKEMPSLDAGKVTDVKHPSEQFDGSSLPAKDSGATRPVVPNKSIYTYDGAISEVKNTGVLVNANKAIIDPNKITSYALNPNHPVGGDKAKVFQSALGYNQSNALDLISKIQTGAKSNTAVLNNADKFGQRVTIDMPITGPNGKTAVVRTGWIYDAGSSEPRLTTLYIKK